MGNCDCSLILFTYNEGHHQRPLLCATVVESFSQLASPDVSPAGLFSSLGAVSCVFFLEEVISEWCISASPFEESTVKTSYANYAQRLTHQRALQYKSEAPPLHTHTHTLCVRSGGTLRET